MAPRHSKTLRAGEPLALLRLGQPRPIPATILDSSRLSSASLVFADQGVALQFRTMFGGPVQVPGAAGRYLARRVVAKIRALGNNPRPVGCEKLSGEDKYRLRQGDCRILYEIFDNRLIVTVVKVGNRRDVYR